MHDALEREKEKLTLNHDLGSGLMAHRSATLVLEYNKLFFMIWVAQWAELIRPQRWTGAITCPPRG